MPGVKNTQGKRSLVPTDVMQTNYSKTPSWDPSTYRGTQEEITAQQSQSVAKLRKNAIRG